VVHDHQTKPDIYQLELVSFVAELSLYADSRDQSSALSLSLSRSDKESKTTAQVGEVFECQSWISAIASISSVIPICTMYLTFMETHTHSLASSQNGGYIDRFHRGMRTNLGMEWDSID
jgi:hypothetical protein